jgi:hypothetical protein
VKLLSWLEKNKFVLLILSIGLIIVLWQLLLPGYILTLDMGFAPHAPFPRIALGGYWNGALFRLPLYVLGLVFPSWLVQKIMLVGLFILLAVSGFRFISPSSSRLTRFWLGLLFVFNPFVYTRFLAGQWTILYAYGLLPLVWYFAEKSGKGERRASVWLGLSLVLTFAFSLHIGVMGLFVWVFALLGSMSVRSVRAWVSSALAGLVLFVGSLYWLIPAFLRKGTSLLEIIDDRHTQAFRTVGDSVLGTVGNVLALYGFWGEREPWAKQFIWAKDYTLLWAVSGGILAAFILVGVYRQLRNRETRRRAVSLLVLGLLAVIFSCGVGDSPFAPINNWLFSHVGFWQGFRDSQKWSAVLVLVYVFFAAQGLAGKYPRVRTIVASLAALVYTFPMLFGFWGQLKPVWYPEAWYRANALLKQDPNCKALFLPWHAYFSLKFNRNLLTANPARDFFDCSLVLSRQVELGAIGDQGPVDPAYDAIEGVVTGKDDWNSEQSLAILQASGIEYVIFAKDIEDSDAWHYDFLHQPSLKSYTWDGLTMYQLTH